MAKDLSATGREMNQLYSAQVRSLGYFMMPALSAKEKALMVIISPSQGSGTIDDVVFDQIKNLFPETVDIDLNGRIRTFPVLVVYQNEAIKLR